MLLGEKLKEMRGNKTLREVSEGTTYSVPYLSDIERNRTEPSLSCLARIARFYSTTVAALLIGVEFPDERDPDVVLPFESNTP